MLSTSILSSSGKCAIGSIGFNCGRTDSSISRSKSGLKLCSLAFGVFRLGPNYTLSATMPVRYCLTPCLSSKDRFCSRPSTRIKQPLVIYSAMVSAVLPHAVTLWNVAPLLSAASHCSHDYQPRMHAQTDSEPYPETRLQPGIEGYEGVEHTQASPHSSVGVVLVRLRRAKVDQEPIPQVLRDVATVALDHLIARHLVGTHDLAQVFGVQPAGEGGGIDQSAEHHRQLTPFGVCRARCARCRGDLRRLCCLSGLRLFGLGRNGRRGWVCTAGPDQHRAVLIDRQALRLNDFGFQV